MVDTLEMFKGQLSLHDIYNMSYKELGYLRKFRAPIIERINKTMGSVGALFG